MQWLPHCSSSGLSTHGAGGEDLLGGKFLPQSHQLAALPQLPFLGAPPTDSTHSTASGSATSLLSMPLLSLAVRMSWGGRDKSVQAERLETAEMCCHSSEGRSPGSRCGQCFLPRSWEREAPSCLFRLPAALGTTWLRSRRPISKDSMFTSLGFLHTTSPSALGLHPPPLTGTRDGIGSPLEGPGKCPHLKIFNLFPSAKNPLLNKAIFTSLWG